MSQVLRSFPDDSVQYLCEKWWMETPNVSICRGRLISAAFIPHIDQEPFVLFPEGRSVDTQHDKATFRIGPFNLAEANKAPTLPVGALPNQKGERRFVYRGKLRPALVIAMPGDEVDRGLVFGSARWQTAKTIVVAPYYGGEANGLRGGWLPAFSERIRHAAYPQYMWDRLPLSGDVDHSILRFDQMQAVGYATSALKLSPYSLTDEAMEVVDDWITWYVQRQLPKGTLSSARELLLG